MKVASFFNLSNDVLTTVFRDWIDTKDLSRLDTAVCERKARQTFLFIVQQKHFTTSGYVAITCDEDDDKKLKSRFVQWLLVRQIQIQSIDLSVLDGCKHLSAQILFSQTQVRRMEASLSNKFQEILALRIIQNSSSKLEAMSFSSPVTDSDLVRLQRWSFPSLICLEFRNIRASPRVLSDFFRSFPLLKHLVLDNLPVFDSTIANSLRDNCPHLRTLSLRSCQRISIEALLAFQKSPFAKLDLSGVSGVSEAAWKKHLSSLVGITRLLILCGANDLTEEVFQTLSGLESNPCKDRILDIRSCGVKINPDLRASLLRVQGLFVLGL